MMSKFLSHLLTGKMIAGALFSITLIGGSTALAASTPTGEHLIHTLTGMTSATSVTKTQPLIYITQTTQTPETQTTQTPEPTITATIENHTQNCPGLSDAQQLAASFSLSTSEADDDIQAICALHQGNFTGITPTGTTVSSNEIFGYDEVQNLLSYALSLATHDATNTSSTLTSNNARSYLAEALQQCGTSPIANCSKNPTPEPDHKKPTSTPTPEPDHKKPTSTPTPEPDHKKPTSTPTPEPDHDKLTILTSM